METTNEQIDLLMENENTDKKAAPEFENQINFCTTQSTSTDQIKNKEDVSEKMKKVEAKRVLKATYEKQKKQK